MLVLRQVGTTTTALLRALYGVLFVQGHGFQRSGQLACGSLFRPCQPPDTVSMGPR